MWGQNQIKQIKRLATSYFNLSTILGLPADAGQIRLNTNEEVAQHRIPSGPHSHEHRVQSTLAGKLKIDYLLE